MEKITGMFQNNITKLLIILLFMSNSPLERGGTPKE